MGTSDNVVSLVRRMKRVGPRGVSQRLAQRAYLLTGAAGLRSNLDLEDLLVEVPVSLPAPTRYRERSAPMLVGWVMTPPAPGSGGHATIFRMITALEKRGHHCRILIYDKHGVDVPELTRRIRAHWPEVRAEIRDVKQGVDGLDAVVGTSWESTHVIVKYALAPCRRLYFIQDFEPYFYAHGAEYEFALMTYQLPFRRIVLGEMLDGMIRNATGLESDVVPFGCDSEIYRPPRQDSPRQGVVFYCRPDAARRGYQLACIALMAFHRLHPDQEIHVYGSKPEGLPIPVTFHGRLSTAQLNDLYGRTITGLAMSFTNITLVAEEMLAAGNIPVVNDMALARHVLPNPHVRWAAPTARALAEALSAAVSASDVGERANLAAASVTGRSWKPTSDAVVKIIEQEVFGS